MFISFNTGLTDSTGVATVTVSVSADTSFTASYSNVSDTCTVTTGPTVLFYDPCSPSYVSENYGTIIPISSSTTINYTAYDSTNNCYKTRANGDWGVIPITALSSADNYKIEAYFKRPNTNAVSQGGFSFANPNNPSNVFYVRMRGDGKVDYGNQNSATNIVSTNLGSGWIKIELTVQSQSIIAKVYDGDTLKGSANITNPISNSVIGLHLVGGTNYGFYVKEIKAVSL